MDDERSGRAAVAVLRAWFDPEPERGLRVRITETADLRDVDAVTMIATSPAEVCRAVERWLARFVDPALHDGPEAPGGPAAPGGPVARGRSDKPAKGRGSYR